nr:MAG TPA: hypothetical protein [Caudoviricetes sp.]
MCCKNLGGFIYSPKYKYKQQQKIKGGRCAM